MQENVQVTEHLGVLTENKQEQQRSFEGMLGVGVVRFEGKGGIRLRREGWISGGRGLNDWKLVAVCIDVGSVRIRSHGWCKIFFRLSWCFYRPRRLCRSYYRYGLYFHCCYQSLSMLSLYWFVGIYCCQVAEFWQKNSVVSLSCLALGLYVTWAFDLMHMNLRSERRFIANAWFSTFLSWVHEA